MQMILTHARNKIGRLLKNFGKGEKGFTLLEVLIVVAILGILAAVIIPNLGAFIGAGNIAAANTEAANVRTAGMAYYAGNDTTWPTDSDDLRGVPSYLNADPSATYAFWTSGDSQGLINTVSNQSGITLDLTWNNATQQWER